MELYLWPCHHPQKMKQTDWFIFGDNIWLQLGWRPPCEVSKNIYLNQWPFLSLMTENTNLSVLLGMELFNTQNQNCKTEMNIYKNRTRFKKTLWKIGFEKPPIEWATWYLFTCNILKNKVVVLLYYWYDERPCPESIKFSMLSLILLYPFNLKTLKPAQQKPCNLDLCKYSQSSILNCV
jgi:hypothetical protein